MFKFWFRVSERKKKLKEKKEKEKRNVKTGRRKRTAREIISMSTEREIHFGWSFECSCSTKEN